jgi:cysteine desulfurase family protein (TIGR01976 family)
VTEGLDLRHRFPGLSDGWSRFDGPAGTQVVDSAIAAIAAALASPATANSHGFFPQSAASDAIVDDARALAARFLGAGDGGAGIVFGPSMTGLTFHVTRSIAATLRPGDEVVGTRLDHDGNVTPWAVACAASGATHRLVPFDPATGRLDMAQLGSTLTDRTRWVAVTGASNAIGTKPDLPAVIAAAHEVGARVYVDAVHLAPHAPIDIQALGCDALVCSAYKWYGPHVGVLWLAPDLLEGLAPAKVRPAPDTGPSRWEQGTLAFESLAGVAAAARFMCDVGAGRLAVHELALFAPLLEGLCAMPHVTVFGPKDLVDRTPTVAFNAAGRTTEEVATHLAARRCAVWHGSYYAVEAMATLGLEAGGAIRVGVSCYTTAADVERLLAAVAELA